MRIVRIIQPNILRDIQRLLQVPGATDSTIVLMMKLGVVKFILRDDHNVKRRKIHDIFHRLCRNILIS